MWHGWDTGQWVAAVIGSAAFWAVILLAAVAVLRGEWVRHHPPGGHRRARARHRQPHAR